MRTERQGIVTDEEQPGGASPDRPRDPSSGHPPPDLRPGISKGLATLIFGTAYGFVVASLIWGVWLWLSDRACGGL